MIRHALRPFIQKGISMNFTQIIIGILLFTIGVPIINFISNLIGTLSDYITLALSVKMAWYNHMIQKINGEDNTDNSDPSAIGFEIDTSEFDEED